MNFQLRSEREAYYLGRTSLDYSEIKINMFFANPYDPNRERNLFTAWEIGFNDGFEEEISTEIILKNLQD
jgi:hypothetical protein